MEQFWLEYLHFIASIIAILVSISTAILFLQAVQYEKKLDNLWRSLGFWSLSIGFLLYILERKYPSFGLSAITMELFGLYAIARGVLTEPNLAHLRKVTSKKVRFRIKVNRLLGMVLAFSIAVPLTIYFLFKFFLQRDVEYTSTIFNYLASILLGISLIFIIFTIIIQIKRYLTESKDPAVRRQNLYPLLGYVYLFARGISLLLYRLPDIDLVIFSKLNVSFGVTWQLSIFFTIGAFVFLGIWAWNFIKIRFTLRTYVLFFSIVTFISSLGSLVFTILIFSVVEQNNLELMLRAVKVQEFVIQDRSDQALLVARTIANDVDIQDQYTQQEYYGLLEDTENYLESTNVDILRIFTKYGEIYVSPSDERDKGRVYNDDSLVSYVLTEQKHIKSMDSQPGVLADTIITRALYPIIVNESLIGVVEAGYSFDNAFVDLSKAQTTLDVTIFSGVLRSATTLQTEDNVSRWIGSQITNSNIIETVLTDGHSYMDREKNLEQIYYSAFRPIKKVDGEIIGMISVGTPVFNLLEDTRQQLVNTFLILTAISLVGSSLGYYVIKSFRHSLKDEKKDT